MEASDPFAGSTAAPPAPAEGAADPFASEGGAPADLEPTTEGDVAAEVAAEPSEEIPVVDREGQRIDAPAEEAGGAVPDTMTAAGRAKAAEAAQAPAQAAEAAEETEEAPEPQADGDGAGEPPQSTTATATPDPAPDPAPAPETEKGELRLYKLLYQSGPGAWQEADLANVAAELKQYIGKDPKDTQNKDGLFIKARNNDHARRLAFVIMGRPAEGVTVELVARTSWKPVRLHVAPPEPSRERLVIS